MALCCGVEWQSNHHSLSHSHSGFCIAPELPNQHSLIFNDLPRTVGANAQRIFYQHRKERGKSDGEIATSGVFGNRRRDLGSSRDVSRHGLFDRNVILLQRVSERFVKRHAGIAVSH